MQHELQVQDAQINDEIEVKVADKVADHITKFMAAQSAAQDNKASSPFHAPGASSSAAAATAYDKGFRVAHASITRGRTEASDAERSESRLRSTAKKPCSSCSSRMSRRHLSTQTHPTILRQVLSSGERPDGSDSIAAWNKAALERGFPGHPSRAPFLRIRCCMPGE